MRAWRTGDRPGSLRPVEEPVPEPGPGEVLVRVEACGVCRTDLHVVDRELPVHRPAVVPGHQVVGVVDRTGPGVRSPRTGDRVGVAWLHDTCGQCRWCRSGRENLCPFSRYTGWDADGGFAERVTAPAAYVYPLPGVTDPVTTAPLLCAGIIGYRALRRANLPPGGALGIYGFGSSAHLTAQVAIAAGARVLAMTRGEGNRQLARRVGAVFVGHATDAPPEPLDSAVVFAPAGELVPLALAATVRGGTVVVAGIHLSDVPVLSYRRHLFEERDLRSVTANTRADGEELLRIAGTLHLVPTTTTWPLGEAPAALESLRSGRASGSLVLVPG